MTLSGRGGKREGAGRPKGSENKEKKPTTVVFYIRCTPEEKKKLQAFIKQLRQKKDEV